MIIQSIDLHLNSLTSLKELERLLTIFVSVWFKPVLCGSFMASKVLIVG